MTNDPERIVARLHEAVFQLVQLECGATSNAAPTSALLLEISRSEDLPDRAAGLLRTAAEHLEVTRPGAEALAVAVREASRLVDEALDAADATDNATGETGAPGRDDDAGADPEMLAGFAVEALELLDSAEHAALDLDAGAAGPAVDTLFRCFHTLKGTAGFLDLPSIVSLAHRAESLLSALRETRRDPDPGEAELILRSVDALRHLVAAGPASSGKDESGWQEVAAALDAAADGRARPDSPVASGEVPRMAAETDSPAKPGSGAATRPGPAGSGDAGGGSEWTRVRTDRLDRLIDGLGQLLVAQSILSQDPAIVGAPHSELAQKAWGASKIVRELQSMALSMRTVTLDGLFRKARRLVHELGRAQGTDIRLELHGEETRIDRNMVDLLSDPIIHMIRNAVDHGIEPPAERRKAGKPEHGRLRLDATNAGNEVVLELSDDGRGVDRARVLARAVDTGLADPDAELSDAELLRMIFLPGFSTAQAVTDLSGRGVGMDVVRRNIEALHGRIEIRSEPGAGTTFTVRVPLTLAVGDGLLVRIGSERYILPSRHVQLSFRPEPGAWITKDGGEERVRTRDAELPLVRLHDLLGVEGVEKDPTAAVLVVVAALAGRRALLVDEVLSQIQVVSKPLGSGLERLPWLSGGAILGDGRVGLILDVPAIVAANEHPAEPVPALPDVS